MEEVIWCPAQYLWARSHILTWEEQPATSPWSSTRQVTSSLIITTINNLGNIFRILPQYVGWSCSALEDSSCSVHSHWSLVICLAAILYGKCCPDSCIYFVINKNIFSLIKNKTLLQLKVLQESPTWLLRKRSEGEAYDALYFYRGDSDICK